MGSERLRNAMLQVKALTFGFRHRRLFEDVSFTVKPGELLHLAGPNGAGKSTMMSILAGLLLPEKGEVEFFPGKDAAAPADDRRSFVEYLPAEANGLYVKMDATTNLQFWSRLRGLATTTEQVFQELDRWNLNHPLLRDGFSVEKFSTGMKRRLALARLNLSPAPCWLLDEPLYGLDTEAVQIFRAMIDRHLARGGLAVLVSHELKIFDGAITRTLTLGERKAGGR